MPNLTSLEWKGAGPFDEADGFPFSVPAIRTLERLDLSAWVTFFVGENGSGKSTLLEAIALAADLPTLGSEEVWRDISLEPQRRLAKALRLTWTRRSRNGFFLRAEDFFGYVRRLARDEARLQRERREAGLRTPPPERAADWDESVHVDERRAAEFVARYDARSHGESFLELFNQRIHGGGLYLLDEPEAPLSPQRQLALLALLADAAAEGAQFLPGARIYSFDEAPVHDVPYAELEHVTLTRDFLQDPQLFLRHLI